MDPDTALVIGLLLGAFSIPSIISAWSDGRAPRASILTLLIAFGLVIFALQMRPEGYTVAEIPDAVLRVVARWIP